jgi:hypothetical protein
MHNDFFLVATIVRYNTIFFILGRDIPVLPGPLTPENNMAVHVIK